MKYLMKLKSFTESKTYIKTYEELKYTQEHQKLVNKLRYALNKVFGNNRCGVYKVKYLISNANKDLSLYTPDYIDYTGSTMLFSIYTPTETNDLEKLKKEKFNKIANEIGLTKELPSLTGDSFIGTEEQMTELIDRLKDIMVEVDADKYNL